MRTHWKVRELNACVNLQFTLLMQAIRDNDLAISGYKASRWTCRIFCTWASREAAFQFLTPAAPMRSSLPPRITPGRHGTEAFFCLIAAIYTEGADAGKKY